MITGTEWETMTESKRANEAPVHPAVSCSQGISRHVAAGEQHELRRNKAAINDATKVIAQIRQYIHDNDTGHECRVSGHTLASWANTLEQSLSDSWNRRMVILIVIGGPKLFSRTVSPTFSLVSICHLLFEVLKHETRCVFVT